MFEEYTPEARRCMFFAHAAARQFGSQSIETGHLLLAVARENIAVVNRFLSAETTENVLRGEVTGSGTASAVVTNPLVNIPFTDESKRVLAFAAEEAARMSSQRVGIEHLLLGLLREGDCMAAQLLREHGADIARIRKELMTSPHQPPSKEERMIREIEAISKIWAEARTDASESSAAVQRKWNAFGRYTAKADRLIFFAKYVAHRWGSPLVQTEHLLLSVLSEEEARLGLFLPLANSRDLVCRQIEEEAIDRKVVIPTEEISAFNENLPLSGECKRALDYANEEATLLGSERIAPEHLILGMLREHDSYAAYFLRQYGAEIERIRKGLAA